MNKVIIYIAVSEDYYGGNVQAFRTKQDAESFIQEQVRLEDGALDWFIVEREI